MSEHQIQSDTLLRALFNNSFNVILLLDRQYRILSLNEAAIRWAGAVYSRVIREGDSALDYLPKEDVDEFVASFSEALNNRYTRSKLFSVVSGPDGDDYWFEYHFYPVSSDGAVSAVYLNILDLRERKTAIDEMAKSAKRFRSLIKNSSDIVVILDTEGAFHYVNDSATKILGFQPRELVEKSIYEYLYPQDQISFRLSFDNALGRHGESFTIQFRLRHRDGTWVFFEATGTNLLHDVSVSGIVLNMRDITDRKHVEEMLVKISRQNELILESAGEGVFGVNMLGKITFVNPAAAKMLGLEVEDIIGKHHGDIIQQLRHDLTPYPGEGLYGFISIRDGSIHRADDLLFKRRDGSVFPVEYITTPIRDRGEIVGVVVTFNDISERKRAEEELRLAKEEADTANRAKGEFLANISHEIRTPINSMLGFMELLGDTGLTATQAEYLNISRESAKSLLEIINDLLDYSKIEKGRIEIEETEFEPLPVFESTVELFTAQAGERRIGLHAFIDPRLPRRLVGDPLRLKQVLNNLISNAVKFTPERGEVYLEVVPKRPTARRCVIHFSVKDTGIGIPVEKQDIIFQSFTQAESSIARRYGGTGLGLSISSDLVKLMDGTIRLESTEGRGSRFFFELAFKTVRTTQREGNSSPSLEGIHAALIMPSNGDIAQEEILLRYLSVLGIPTRLVRHPGEIQITQPPTVLFAVYSSLSKEGFSLLLRASRGRPLILVCNDWERNEIVKCTSGTRKAIIKPIVASKIINALRETMVRRTRGTNQSRARAVKSPALGTALVAEDTPSNQQLMKIMLSKLGMETVIAGNGKEAVRLGTTRSFDIIFMDINMPVYDGMEASRRIIAHEKKHSLPHTPIVALTAKAMKGDRESLFAAGIDGYCAKPIDMSSLTKTVLAFARKPSPVKRDGCLEARAGAGVPSVLKIKKELGLEDHEISGIIREFFSSARSYMKALDRAVSRNDFGAIMQAAHRMKGASANMRLHRLQRLCETVENASDRSEKLDYRDYAEKIKKEMGIAEKRLLKDL